MHMQVYRMCMTRTNIDLDDELVARVMARYRLKTKKDAVHLALHRLAGPPLTTRALEALEGIGWVGDLDGQRRGRDTTWTS
ncbi:type II toxin-antitoxin system VapB family antitoxin [soil metagenome]